MDEYFLSKEDWDALLELGVGEQGEAVVGKTIASATKSALTRRYNASEHPLPFHKGADGGKVKRLAGAGGPAPDLEDAFDVRVSRLSRRREPCR
jgi:replication factor C subunit 1